MEVVILIGLFAGGDYGSDREEIKGEEGLR
jgi:hypothetical protein